MRGHELFALANRWLHCGVAIRQSVAEDHALVG